MVIFVQRERLISLTMSPLYTEYTQQKLNNGVALILRVALNLSLFCQ